MNRVDHMALAIHHNVNKIIEDIPSNAEGKLPKGLIRMALAIDTVGGFRQAAAAASATLGLAGKAASACFFGALVPLALLFTGPATVALAMKYAIPDAQEQLAEAKETARKAKKYLNQPLERVEFGRGVDALQEAKRALKIAKLGMVNQTLLTCMGLGQTATAAVELLASPPAFLHYAPLITAAAAKVATLATTIGLSAIYFLRGATMVYRAKENLQAINALSNDFHANKSVPEAIEFMKGMEALGPDYLKRRLDVSCLDGMTAAGCQTLTEQKEYVKRVDKAIYSQALKHKVAMCIGFAMIMGAVLGVIAANLAAGCVPLLIVSLGSALFFLCVEVPFLVYDSPKFFTMYRDFFYAQREAVEFAQAPKAVPEIELERV